MEKKVVYLSEEWAAEALRRINEELSPERMNNVTTSMSNIYKNCPDGKERYLFIQAEDGRVTRLVVGQGEPPKAEFTITGDYEVFASISRAELGSQRALMTGKLKVRGNLTKALRLAALADRLNKVLSTIPAVY
ncbi:MAG TPA: SCP2 sterol-binding domain-containing protein [Deltaproteobacteria bacterium]|nr:SCP2 sterol-binding domain-containing protein [Deltaproteobacteria bacterium]